jgi:RNA recognition motif-containing protein
MNIYISNLSSGIKDNDLANLFSPYGEVKSAAVVNDLFTGESRGFGYVEIEDEMSAQKAIDELNNSEVESLVISVTQAKPKEEHKGSYKVGNGAVNVYKFRKN